MFGETLNAADDGGLDETMKEKGEEGNEETQRKHPATGANASFFDHLGLGKFSSPLSLPLSLSPRVFFALDPPFVPSSYVFPLFLTVRFTSAHSPPPFSSRLFLLARSISAQPSPLNLLIR